MSRWRAERIPAVTLPPSPKGLPIAKTQSPTRDASLSPQLAAVKGLSVLTFSKRDVGLGVAPDELRLQMGVVVQDDGDFVGVGDDVIVGHHIARRVDDKARTERGALRGCASGRPPFGTPRSKKSRKNSSKGDPGGNCGISGPLCSRPRSDFTV